MELSLATIEDMVAELERRFIAVGMVISHLDRKEYKPSVDVPPEDREKCYADSYYNKHPMHLASFLCRGIQFCLSDLFDRVSMEGDKLSEVEAIRAEEAIVALSKQLNHFNSDMDFWMGRFHNKDK